MNYVFHVILALASLALVQLDWVRPQEHVWAVPLLALVPYALGHLSRRAFLSGRFRLGSLLERLLAAAPVLLQAAAVAGLGWVAALQRWGVATERIEDWIGLGLTIGLAPYLLYQVAAIDARARSLVFAPEPAHGLRSFHLRMFLAALLPFLAYLACASLLASSPVWRVRLEEVGLLGALASVMMLALFVQLMPFFLRRAWDTTPIPRGWARTMLEQVAKKAGFHYRELLVWNTGQHMANAAIVGLSARSRHVFFSDLLLQQLGPRELAAVFAHEMGHARRAHPTVFGAFVLGFFLWAARIAGWSGIEDPLAAWALLAGTGTLWYASFGYLSRRFELEADLESLRLVGDGEALIHALELVTGCHAHERSSWRHFSTRERVEFLQRAERDPLVGIRLKQRLARWRKLVFALFAVAALLELWDLAHAWDHDWLTADLRLGRFAEAAARADAPGVDADLSALARLAGSVPEGARDGDSLERAALEAASLGDLALARGWLKLAILRGRDDLAPFLERLEAKRALSAADLPPGWRPAPAGAPH